MLEFFRILDLTIHQDKKCLAFFCRIYIMQFLHSEIVCYKCNYWPNFISLILAFFKIWTHNESCLFGIAVILGAYCDTCLYMLHIAMHACIYIGCMLPVDKFCYLLVAWVRCFIKWSYLHRSCSLFQQPLFTNLALV